MQIIDCQQRSYGWLRARLGIATASNFSTVLANGRGGDPSKTRRLYLLKLAGERLTGEPAASYVSPHMERGIEMEDEARSFYELMTDAEIRRVGFVRGEIAGCSPDSLVGDRGMLEIKTAQPNVLIDLMLREGFPAEHKAQVQGQLWIAEREWVDLLVYWPSLPPIIRRAYRDEKYIADLAAAVEKFDAELAAIVERVKTHGSKEAA